MTIHNLKNTDGFWYGVRRSLSNLGVWPDYKVCQQDGRSHLVLTFRHNDRIVEIPLYYGIDISSKETEVRTVADATFGTGNYSIHRFMRERKGNSTSEYGLYPVETNKEAIAEWRAVEAEITQAEALMEGLKSKRSAIVLNKMKVYEPHPETK